MKAEFAKAIARNIRIIAEETAKASIIEADPNQTTWNREYQRSESTRRIDKAEDNIAQWLQQPGTWNG